MATLTTFRPEFTDIGLPRAGNEVDVYGGSHIDGKPIQLVTHCGEEPQRWSHVPLTLQGRARIVQVIGDDDSIDAIECVWIERHEP